MKPEIEAAAVWLEKQIDGIKFGEASIKIVVHAGKARLERAIIHRDEMQDNKK